MSGQDSIVEEPTSLDWPVDDTFIDAPAAEPDAESESEESGLWSRSRDFDWGD